MRFFATAALTVVAALSGHAVADDCASVPIEGPFKLSVVLKDGSATYATNVVPVSRGVPILNPAVTSDQDFTWNADEKRVIYDTSYYSGKIGSGETFYFTNAGGMPETGSYFLQQYVDDCAVYLVKEGTSAEDGIYQWWSADPSDSPAAVTWYGGENSKSNAAVRVDAI